MSILKKPDYFLVVCVIIFAALGFLNLGNQYLWQDETENAVISENILKFGYPTAYDGNLLVISDIVYGDNYIWLSKPWLQNYIIAASFYLFGKSNFSARFIFVVFGIFAFIGTYYLARRLFSVKTARVSAVILMTSVPFLLLTRQARYYALLAFFAVMLVHAYLDYAGKGIKYYNFMDVPYFYRAGRLGFLFDTQAVSILFFRRLDNV